MGAFGQESIGMAMESLLPDSHTHAVYGSRLPAAR